MRGLIPGFPEHFVTLCGKVFSGQRQLKTHLCNGYERVTLTHEGRGKKFFVHVLVALVYLRNPLNHLQVNHKDGIKTNNKVNNLEWVSRSENMLHASSQLGFRGEAVGNSALTEFQVLEVIRLSAMGASQSHLARRFGVSKFCIHSIQTGKTWAWLTGVKNVNNSIRVAG